MRHWPVLNLRLTTPRLELRLPSLDDLDELADRALEGVHDPDLMPFGVPWTDAPADELPGNVVRYQLGLMARWQPGNWCCNFVVVHEGRVIGTQDLTARSFPVTREVHTGSWLGRAHQGQGLGTEMRAAVLHLAFEGLAARTAVSSAFLDNPASLAVSRKLGYRPDGMEVHQVRGRRAVQQRLRLDRSAFIAPVPVKIHGLEPCLPHFGLSDSAPSSPGPA
ncbi:GNAT family N-acetyltransferase [Nonomuraea phyllanthi]|uniref:GNAT family N-acetyltransferase n=1 Tax=Nonomuraea phyllanthi TaxID=2219224 RepID=A0A5C4WEU9_9ACTN|nr:GNAT family N-acetyltransferase [Nonomuraea phyllanthi]KAB8193461.1 GNAT family N-acetyltransferase [Nonomuraea phyllanthi]QFY12204.1 GNAT family N-acetyltransferase [Nonomuraea phyllanthi]